MPSREAEKKISKKNQEHFFKLLSIVKKHLVRLGVSKSERPKPVTTLMRSLEPLVLAYHWLLKNTVEDFRSPEAWKVLCQSEQPDSNIDDISSVACLIKSICEQVFILNRGDGEEKAESLREYADQIVKQVDALSSEHRRAKSIEITKLKAAVLVLSQYMMMHYPISELDYHITASASAQMRLRGRAVKQLKAQEVAQLLEKGNVYVSGSVSDFLETCIGRLLESLISTESSMEAIQKMSQSMGSRFNKMFPATNVLEEVAVLPVLRDLMKITEDAVLGSFMLRYMIQAFEKSWSLDRVMDQLPLFECIIQGVRSYFLRLCVFSEMTPDVSMDLDNLQQVLPLFESLNAYWCLDKRAVRGLFRCFLDKTKVGSSKQALWFSCQALLKHFQIKKRVLPYVRVLEQIRDNVESPLNENLRGETVKIMLAATHFLMLCARDVPLPFSAFLKTMFDHILMHLKQGWGEHYTRKALSSIVQSVEWRLQGESKEACTLCGGEEVQALSVLPSHSLKHTMRDGMHPQLVSQGERLIMT